MSNLTVPGGVWSQVKTQYFYHFSQCNVNDPLLPLMKHPLGVNAPPGSWWSRAAHFEVAVARLAINGFRERNGSQMTNNVAAAASAQMNSPSFSSSPRNNSRSTSRILMDFLPSLHPPPSQPSKCERSSVGAASPRRSHFIRKCFSLLE